VEIEDTPVFQGLTGEEMSEIVRRLSARHFDIGDELIREGTRPGEMFILQGGHVEVFMDDRRGGVRRLGELGPGSVVGEMSLISGALTSASVVALSAVEARVMDELTFHEVASAFPRIYHNIGTILSQKLSSANRSLLYAGLDRVSVLVDDGGPPVLWYALACSMAWHARDRILLLVVRHDVPVDIAGMQGVHSGGVEGALVSVRGERAEGSFGHGRIAGSLQDLCLEHFRVLLVVSPGFKYPDGVRRVARLTGPQPVFGGAGSGWMARARLQERGVTRSERAIDIPELTKQDERYLDLGVLPLGSVAGSAIGRLARALLGSRVGVALGAGGTKGYAHIGALAGLSRLNIPVDTVAGTSIGACIAALRAEGRGVDEMVKALDEVGAACWRWTVSRRSMASNAGLRAGLQHVFGEVLIEDLAVPFAAVAADMQTQQEVVLRGGPLWAALLASASIPGIWPPQEMGGRVLIDGGVVNPVPSDIAANLGADQVIALKLSPRASLPAVSMDASPTTNTGPSVVQTTLRAIEMMQNRVQRVAGVPTMSVDVLFGDEDLPSIRRFSEGRKFMELGARAIEERRADIEAMLPWAGG
jgi:NTE family protein